MAWLGLFRLDLGACLGESEGGASERAREAREKHKNLGEVPAPVVSTSSVHTRHPPS